MNKGRKDLLNASFSYLVLTRKLTASNLKRLHSPHERVCVFSCPCAGCGPPGSLPDTIRSCDRQLENRERERECCGRGVAAEYGSQCHGKTAVQRQPARHLRYGIRREEGDSARARSTACADRVRPHLWRWVLDFGAYLSGCLCAYRVPQNAERPVDTRHTFS